MHPTLIGLRDHIVKTFALDPQALNEHDIQPDGRGFRLHHETWRTDAVLEAVKQYFAEQRCTAVVEHRLGQVFPPVIVRRPEPSSSAVITITIHGRQLSIGQIGMNSFCC